jgi:hypothetical protein
LKNDEKKLLLSDATLQLRNHIFSLQVRSKLEIENISFGPPLDFRFLINNFQKLSFGTL